MQAGQRSGDKRRPSASMLSIASSAGQTRHGNRRGTSPNTATAGACGNRATSARRRSGGCQVQTSNSHPRNAEPLTLGRLRAPQAATGGFIHSNVTTHPLMADIKSNAIDRAHKRVFKITRKRYYIIQTGREHLIASRLTIPCVSLATIFIAPWGLLGSHFIPTRHRLAC